MINYKNKQRPEKDKIFGIRAVIEAVKAGKEIDRVMIKNGIEGELTRELKIVLHQNHINIQYVPVEKINKNMDDFCRFNARSGIG